jgi:uncharacterized protein YlxP (DUF503 family)
VKITFEDEPDAPAAKPDSRQGGGRRDLHTLVERIRGKFKVCAAAISGEDVGEGASLAVTALGSSEEKLSRTLDAIVDFCEESGFGRIASEEALLDHIDALAALSEE